MNRRRFLAAAAATGPLAARSSAQSSGAAPASAPAKGRLKQAVTRGVFGRNAQMTMDDMCREAAARGIVGFDLVGPQAFPTLKKYGLIPTMAPGGSSIRDGINNKAHHDAIEKRLIEAIDAAAQAGAPNVILLSGERKGMADAEGADNSVAFLNKVKARAEDKGVTLCVELLNSKVNHPDYMCDRTAWGLEVCKRVDSPRVKLLYDIYHMQIMEGDVIRTIRDNIKWLGHFHTAGNPGRHEFDETQELNYRAIATAIADLGFTGYIAHEYTPLKDPMRSLEEAVRICSV
ncbi:MAG TPA: hydroxypyruvate isomerase [Solibacterales bacterium]|nr:hydroxypyruvate isomerase [Bryobacterales bacterium]